MSMSGTPWDRPPQQPEFRKISRVPTVPRRNPRGTGRFMIGEVLGQTFSVVLANIIPFGSLAVLVTAPPYLYAFLFDPQLALASMDFSYGMPWKTITFSIFDYLLTYLVSAALVYGTFQEIRGRRASLGDCINTGVALIFPVVGVSALAGIATFLGMLAFVIPGVIVMIVLWVAIPAAVIERQGVFKSLSRSANLTSGYRWKIFFIAVILFVVAVIASFVAEFFISLFASLRAAVLVNFFLFAAIALVSGVVSAISYHQLRLAKEGADINEIAAVFD